MCQFFVRYDPFLCVVLTAALGGLCHGQDDEPLAPIGAPGIGSAYKDAERLFDDSQYERALARCDGAIDDILPDRIYNRFQAMATRCCLRLNRREEALRRIELIWQRDPGSPYLGLVPLVWDDRLPEQERCTASPEDLVSSSSVRRLAAASSLLQDLPHRDHCIQVLTKIRANRQLPLTLLAETQLWRVNASETDSVPLQIVQQWQKRAAAFPETLRAGPQFVVGRAYQVRHKPDLAVLELLWAPMMAADDPYLAASGLAESVVCLEAVGRGAAAQRLRRELQHRYRHTSAARRLAGAPTGLPVEN